MLLFRYTNFLSAALLSCHLYGEFASSTQAPLNVEPVYQQSNIHAVIASGYAWTMSPNIRNIDYSTWAESNSGYNASLGNSPFVMLGFGVRLFHLLDLDLNYNLYGTFYYQKNQTDPSGDKRTRFFDLDHQGALFNASIYPYTIHSSKVDWIPFIGMGVGVGVSTVSHFQTVLYDLVDGETSVTSIGGSNISSAFAWQGIGGLRIQPTSSRLALDIAYRYYNGGVFETSSMIVNYYGIGAGGEESVTPWKGTFQTNQLYFSLNFAI